MGGVEGVRCGVRCMVEVVVVEGGGWVTYGK